MEGIWLKQTFWAIRMSNTTEISAFTHCFGASDLIIYAVLMAFFLAVVMFIAKTGILPVPSRLRFPSKHSPFTYFGVYHVIKEKTEEIASYQSAVRQQDARLLELTRHIEDLQMKLSQAQSGTDRAIEVAITEAKKDAVKQLAQKDEEMNNIAHQCRRALDPEHAFRFRDHLDINTLSMLVKQYESKRERALKDLERREMALGGGHVVQELKDAKAMSKLKARQFATEKEEMKEKIALLTTKNAEQQRSIQGLGEQIDELKETKNDVSRVLALTRDNVREKTMKNDRLEKILSEQNHRLEEAAKTERATTAELVKAKEIAEIVTTKIEVLLAKESANHHRVMDDYERQFAEKARDCLGFEILVGDLRANIETLKRKNHQEKLALLRQLAMLESAQTENSKGKWTQEHEELARRGHQDEMRAASAREVVLMKQVEGLKAEKAAWRTREHEDQSLRGHQEEMTAAADREDELNELIQELKTEKAALRTQLASEGEAHREIIGHVSALRARMANELGFEHPDIASLQQCTDAYGSRLQEARVFIAGQVNQLHELNALIIRFKAQEDAAKQEYQALKASELQRKNELSIVQAKYEAGQVLIDQLKAKDTTNGRPLREAREKVKQLCKKFEDKKVECEDLCDKLEASKQALTKEQAKIDAVKASHVDTVKYLKNKFDELQGKMNMQLHDAEGDLHLTEFIFNLGYDIVAIESIEQDVALARAISEEDINIIYDDNTWDLVNQLGSCHIDFDKLNSLLSKAVAEESEEEEEEKPLPTVQSLRETLADWPIDYEYYAKDMVQDTPELTSQVMSANKRVEELRAILEEGAEELAREARFDAQQAAAQDDAMDEGDGEEEKKKKKPEELRATKELCIKLREKLIEPR